MLTYSKDIPEKIHADVFVAGGGPAGVAAAVSCARQGKTVFIAEESGCFGGSSTLALVPELMNFDDGKNFLCGGIGREIHDALFGETPCDRRWYAVQSERIKRLYDEIVQKSGADFLFFSKLIDVVTSDGTVTAAIISGKSGLFAVSADVFIDCTGSGALCAMAGADFEYGGENGAIAASTLCSVWSGVDFAGKTVKLDGEKYDEAYNNGVFSQYDGLLPGIKPTDPEHGVGGGNVGHCFGVNDTDERSMTEAMIYGRKSMDEYRNYYSKYIEGFGNVSLLQTANVLGVRESRRIIGDIVMSIEHFNPDNVFEDEIGRYSYPIDIHPETPDKKGLDAFVHNVAIRHGDGESYGISYRALTPKKLKNVLVAGRSISADRAMQASMRVIPCCYITGQSAGVAAAVCKNGNVHETPVNDIQQSLIKMGAYLPNYNK